MDIKMAQKNRHKQAPSWGRAKVTMLTAGGAAVVSFANATANTPAASCCGDPPAIDGACVLIERHLLP